VLALERWREKHGASSSKWFGAYGALEALASLGLVAHDFPAFAWPELVSDLRFEARELGHPLVPATRRVCNDVTGLDAGHALVVTGSNMSGKSTLLRSIGVATAMAMAGGPVCAEKLVLGPVRLVTSMRVSDSLAEGASRFYAELRRLSLVVEMAAKAPGVLFLLDEVLYGTNARERLIGSRATLAWLLEHGALGAVSTHDLALADLEGPLAGKARNVHFEEQVAGDTMTFDYKLREGVVKSSNALRLMRQLGLPVGDS
jgi:DNA mismatch repair ATPase MutS